MKKYGLLILMLIGCFRMLAQKVGIGTPSPDHKLTVYETVPQGNTNSLVLKLKGQNPVLSFSDQNDNTYGYLKMWSYQPFAPYTNGLVIGANPGYPIFFSSNNYGVTMTVANNGYVGIGTTLPDYKLTVNSNVVETNNNTQLLKLTGRNPVLAFTDENSNGFGYIKSWTNAPFAPYTNGMVIGANPGYPIFLSTNNYGVTMTIADNGNVGIGTTTPTQKLSVNGTIRTKEVIVETGWADYVFEDAYPLRSIPELAQFIRINKHLPNIPSAPEVEKNGLQVGDMQKRMMEKIEELALYIIQLHERIDKLEQNKTSISNPYK